MAINLEDRIPLNNGKNNKIYMPDLPENTSVAELVQMLKSGAFADVLYNNIAPGEENSGVQQVGTVINADLIESLYNGEISDVRVYGGLVPEENWLPCDGAFYEKTEYPELFSKLGYETDIVANLRIDIADTDMIHSFDPLQVNGLGWNLFAASNYQNVRWFRIKNVNDSLQKFSPEPGDARWACYNSGIQKLIFFGKNGHSYIAGPGMVTWEDANTGFTGGENGKCAYNRNLGLTVFWRAPGDADDHNGFMLNSTRNYSIYDNSENVRYISKMVDIGTNNLYGIYDPPQYSSLDDSKILKVGNLNTLNTSVTPISVGLESNKSISDITSGGSTGYWITSDGYYGSFNDSGGTQLGVIGTGESSIGRICATNKTGLLIGSHGNVLWYMDNGSEKSLMRFDTTIQSISTDGTHIWIATNYTIYTIDLLYTTNYFSVPDYRNLPGKFYIKAK